jgi:Flp pilus assembly protein TadD
LLVEKAPLLALCIIFSAVTMHTIPGTAPRPGRSPPLAGAVVNYGWYLEQTILPHGLTVDYGDLEESISPGRLTASLAALGLITALALWQARRRPALLVGWLWFLGTLVPVIGLVQFGVQTLADRFTYFPSLGISMALAWCAGDALEAFCRLGNRSALVRRGLVWTLGGTSAFAVLVALAIATARQVRIWRDSETLWVHALSVTDRNWLAHTNLADHYFGKAQLEKARRHFAAAVEIWPTYRQANLGLGTCCMQSGDLDGALRAFESFRSVHPQHPGIHYFLGVVRQQRQQLDEAARDFAEATRLEPGNAEFHERLAEVLEKQGNQDEALTGYQRVLRLAPGLATAHFRLGTLYGKRGDNVRAVEHLKTAIRLRPQYAPAFHNLGVVFKAAGLPRESEAALRRARELAGGGKR